MFLDAIHNKPAYNAVLKLQQFKFLQHSLKENEQLRTYKVYPESIQSFNIKKKSSLFRVMAP